MESKSVLADQVRLAGKDEMSYDKLVDQMRRHRMTYGMVQNVEFHLLFLRLSGVRLFPVELGRHQKEAISLVKILKIMKKCAVLE